MKKERESFEEPKGKEAKLSQEQSRKSYIKVVTGMHAGPCNCGYPCNMLPPACRYTCGC